MPRVRGDKPGDAPQETGARLSDHDGQEGPMCPGKRPNKVVLPVMATGAGLSVPERSPFRPWG